MAHPHSTPSWSKSSPKASSTQDVTPRPNSFNLRTGNGGAGGGEISAAQKLLFTSTRNLSVSFQGESYSLQVRKAKPAPSPSTRKGTPERRKATTPFRADQSENSKPTEQQRWPARLRQPNSMSMCLDFMDERKRMSGSGANVVRALQSSMVDNVDGRLRLKSSTETPDSMRLGSLNGFSTSLDASATAEVEESRWFQRSFHRVLDSALLGACRGAWRRQWRWADLAHEPQAPLF